MELTDLARKQGDRAQFGGNMMGGGIRHNLSVNPNRPPGSSMLMGDQGQDIS
jgi:hypothetical protein